MRYTLPLLMALIMIGNRIAYTQDECPVLPVIETTDICDLTGRDQLCYVIGTIQTDADGFSAPGDIIDLSTVKKLELSQDAAVLMHLSANMPDDQFATVLLFGGVTFEMNAVEVQAVEVEIRATANANIRSGPSTNYGAVGRLVAGGTATALGRNEAGDWLFITFGEGQIGWVFAELMTTEGDLSTLSVVADDATAAPSSSSTAFTLLPTEETPNCSTSGMLVQTPADGAKATLMVNNTQVEIGSTGVFSFIRKAYFESVQKRAAELIAAAEQNPSTELLMEIAVLEGQLNAVAFLGPISVWELKVLLEDAFETISFAAGTSGMIPLDAEGVPTTQPNVVPYDDEQVAVVEPLLEVLPEAVKIVPAVTEGVDPFVGYNPAQAEAVQSVVGTWQFESVDPNTHFTGGANGGCTTYPTVGQEILQLSPAPGGISNGANTFVYNAENNNFVYDYNYADGSRTVVHTISVEDENLKIVETTMEPESSCGMHDGEVLMEFIKIYVRSDIAFPNLTPEEVAENLTGVWEYVESDVETLTCANGVTFDLTQFATSRLTFVSSGQINWVLFEGETPQQAQVFDGGARLLWFEDIFALESMMVGRVQHTQIWLGDATEEELTIISHHNYSEAATFNMQGEITPADCPDIVFVKHTYRQVSNEVPELVTTMATAYTTIGRNWDFVSAEPRQATCNDVTVDTAGAAVNWQFTPTADGMRLWFSVHNYRSTLGWENEDYADLTFDAETGTFKVELPEKNVIYEIDPVIVDGLLSVIKTSTEPACEFTATLQFRASNTPIPQTELAPTEVVQSLTGSWRQVSIEPQTVTCGTQEKQIQYDFSSLDIQPDSRGIALRYNIKLRYDPELEVFRGQDLNTGAIVLVPAEVAGNTLVVELTGILSYEISSGTSNGMEICYTEPVSITITYQRQ